ncbi:hypothetical protein B1748_00695 [Paenibacillus sp. MY03]|jgi:hypothetical protein|uniref:ABC transporter permease n=1 Tax=Paenibacillus sp. MY03 TaxID=302980 RepID=UPI000B3C2CCA|nr:ABC transporter permease [Paenibacillus sp. MY03]OUS78628.1 hypothetical protein B1748_00695 [Paenibacillus sp. MY03]
MGFRSFLGLLGAERLKLSRSLIWLLVPISPLLAALIGAMSNLTDVPEASRYDLLQSTVFMLHALLLLPILTGIFSSFVCRYEHNGGGWKATLSLPVSRTALYGAKFIMVAALLAAVQLIMIGALLAASAVQGITGSIDWQSALVSLLTGWIACLPLAALQLWASIGWSSFAAPLAINVSMTIPNILIINSDKYGPFYPWAQPALGMLVEGGEQNFGAFNLPLENILVTVGCSFVLFVAGGLLYLHRKEI